MKAMNRLTKLAFALSLIFLPIFCGAAAAQQKEDFPSGALRTDCGYLLVWNEPGNYYTLAIPGSDVRQTSTEQIQFSVDGVFLQVVTPKIASFLKDRKNLDAKSVLAAHRDWEASFMESEYKEKLKIESFPQKLPGGEDALLWQFDVPASAKSNVKKQTYLAVVKGDYILLLGSIVTEKITEKASHRLLLLTALSLRASDRPTDLMKIQEIFKMK
ncbi:MAG: hypothetical protein JSS81_05135 [Acidobacteria bacterium]|nr:hypothetical protein [Acidobacteriota bacterium]